MLIEWHDMKKFRALYSTAPLMTMKRNPRPTERWQEIYGQDFGAWMTGLPRK